jgi:hypothetical protein
MRFAKVKRCDGGRIQVNYDARLWKWRPWRCGTCNVVVLPYMTRWVDLTWWSWWLPWTLSKWTEGE